MKGMKGIQRSSHPELTRMVKLLRKQNLGLHDEKKALVAMNAELVEALEYHSNANISHEKREYEFNLKIRAEGLNNG